MRDRITELFKAQHRLKQRLGRDPSVEEAAEDLGITPKKVTEILRIAQDPISLESPLNAEDNAVLGDFIQYDVLPYAEDKHSRTLLKQKVAEILGGRLLPRERRVLELRFGVFDGREYTLLEVGGELGVTAERVRQIEAQALARLRNPYIEQQLQDFRED